MKMKKKNKIIEKYKNVGSKVPSIDVIKKYSETKIDEAEDLIPLIESGSIGVIDFSKYIPEGVLPTREVLDRLAKIPISDPWDEDERKDLKRVPLTKKKIDKLAKKIIGSIRKNV
jgi:hypothetical protein